ncbi:hypothetical protein EYF80_028449 [Liparis tanakae]|uniref:Uncharacterized protein n=1 Tax=Liparis tanakae TaxID=230148 RepID=A0A4Z2H979_9TELE|nr:hypothetical protein EYF80_028449 [Liparis tanakae]
MLPWTAVCRGVTPIPFPGLTPLEPPGPLAPSIPTASRSPCRPSLSLTPGKACPALIETGRIPPATIPETCPVLPLPEADPFPDGAEPTRLASCDAGDVVSVGVALFTRPGGAEDHRAKGFKANHKQTCVVVKHAQQADDVGVAELCKHFGFAPEVELELLISGLQALHQHHRLLLTLLETLSFAQQHLTKLPFALEHESKYYDDVSHGSSYREADGLDHLLFPATHVYLPVSSVVTSEITKEPLGIFWNLEERRDGTDEG